MLFLRIFQHLLPRSQAWRITTQKMLRRFFEGLSAQPENTRLFADKVYQDLFPETARSKDNPDPAEASGALEEWERQFGLEPKVDEAARRLALAAEWAATGGQSPDYIQGVLQTAGFPVYVHDWWSSGPPYVARDPRDYTDTPRVGIWRCSSFASQPRCSNFASGPRCNAFLNNDPHYLVNKDLTLRAPPPIPSDPAKWPYFVYVGGEIFGDTAIVDAARRAEFERLLLKLRPLHLWIVTLVTYAALSGDPIITEDGDFIITEDGDFVVID